MRKLKLFLKYLYRLGFLNFLSYLYQRFIKKSKIIFIKVPGLFDRVLIRNNPNDIQIFSQIFIKKEYDVNIGVEVKTIIDCGANIGLASLYFLSKFPYAKIIAIEPEQKNFSMLKRNLANYKNVTCVKKGLWHEEVNLEIMDYGRGDAGFIIKESNNMSEYSIKAVSINNIIDEFQLEKIDILKVDIEGSEEQVFLNTSDWLKKVNLIFCEIHENMKPGLTEKIKSKLIPFFNFFIHGEYHVFIRRQILNN